MRRSAGTPSSGELRLGTPLRAVKREGFSQRVAAKLDGLGGHAAMPFSRDAGTPASHSR